MNKKWQNLGQFGIIWHTTFTKKRKLALADVAQWIECWPVNQRVAGLIPSQGTGLGCRPGLQLRAQERQTRIDVSLLLSPSHPLPLKINK